MTGPPLSAGALDAAGRSASDEGPRSLLLAHVLGAHP